MMLLTVTRSPPSWAAMLPQKFSAATTCSRPRVAADDPSEHPPLTRAIPRTRAANRTPRNLTENDSHYKPVGTGGSAAVGAAPDEVDAVLVDLEVRLLGRRLGCLGQGPLEARG